MARFLLVASACLGVALAAAPAAASNVQVDPTRVSLSEERQSRVLTLKNRNPEPARFQIRVYAWTHDERGEAMFEPTDDLVVYPTIFEVDPGENRQIRIGAATSAGSREKSYRIFLEELPPVDGAGRPGAVQVKMRIGIPIFVAPRSPRAEARIGKIAASGEQLTFHILNTGSVHQRLHEVRAVGRDAAGEVTFDRRLDGWYLLAGRHRRFTLPLDTACSELSSVDLHATTGQKRWTRSVAVDGCVDGD